MLYLLSVLAFVTIFLGVFGARAALLGAPQGPRHKGAYAALGVVAVFLALSLSVWGAVSIIWYLALGTFMLASACGTIVVNRKNWTGWFAASPLLNAASILGSLYLWIWHWPFG